MAQQFIRCFGILSKSDLAYIVGVAFSEMKEQDKELLIKHVVKRQMQQIREHKEN
jgi:c-di-GMP-binding flagellar brake protein YcgR